MTGAHSTLGASSSHRWLECPGSIRLSEGMPNESSVYAREGSCAHSIAEMCLNQEKDAIFFLGEEVKGYEEIDVDEEMCDAVQIYLDTVRAAVAEYTAAGYDDYDLGVEVRFDLSHVHPGMFGTCDATLYFPAWKKLNVYDYKHGWVTVDVERNPQTMYYGVGALTGKHNRAIEKIELIIVQPNSTHEAVKRWDCDPADLLDFIADLKAGAARTENPEAAFKAGEWCKYCPAAPKCRTLEKKVEDLAMAEFEVDGTIKLPLPEGLSLDRLALIKKNAGIFEAWFKNINSFTHQLAVAGTIIPEHKLVEGRSRRRYKDAEAAEKTLLGMQAIGEIEVEIYQDKKLKSPAQLETALGKDKGKIANLWEKGQGKISLVPITDGRAVAKTDALNEFM